MPIVKTIFSVLSAPLDDRDQVSATERRLLQRSYFSFLSTLINNDVAEVLTDQGE
jgi:exportin-T